MAFFLFGLFFYINGSLYLNKLNCNYRSHIQIHTRDIWLGYGIIGGWHRHADTGNSELWVRGDGMGWDHNAIHNIYIQFQFTGQVVSEYSTTIVSIARTTNHEQHTSQGRRTAHPTLLPSNRFPQRARVRICIRPYCNYGGVKDWIVLCSNITIYINYI